MVMVPEFDGISDTFNLIGNFFSNRNGTLNYVIINLQLLLASQYVPHVY